MKRSERLGAGELEQQLRWGVRCRGCDWPGLAHFGAGDSIWRISFSVLCFCSFVCYQSSLPWGFSQPQEEEDSVRIEQLHLIPLKRYLKQGQYRVFWGESFPAQHQDWSLYPVARWNREHVWKWFWSATASILSRALLFHNKAIKHPTGWFLHCAVCICRFTEVSFLLGNDYALHMLSGRDFGLLWCWGRFGGTSSAAASNWKEKPSSENTMQRARCDGIVLSIPNTLFRDKISLGSWPFVSAHGLLSRTSTLFIYEGCVTKSQSRGQVSWVICRPCQSIPDFGMKNLFLGWSCSYSNL